MNRNLQAAYQVQAIFYGAFSGWLLWGKSHPLYNSFNSSTRALLWDCSFAIAAPPEVESHTLVIKCPNAIVANRLSKRIRSLRRRVSQQVSSVRQIAICFVPQEVIIDHQVLTCEPVHLDRDTMLCQTFALFPVDE